MSPMKTCFLFIENPSLSVQVPRSTAAFWGLGSARGKTSAARCREAARATRNCAPLRRDPRSTTRCARRPSARRPSRSATSATTAAASSAASRTSLPASAASKSSTVSLKLKLYWPNSTGTPKIAGSMRLWPPLFAPRKNKLPPTNAMSAIAYKRPSSPTVSTSSKPLRPGACAAAGIDGGLARDGEARAHARAARRPPHRPGSAAR